MYLTLSLSLFFIFIIVVICTILYDNEDTVTIMTEWKLVPNVDAHSGIEIKPDENGVLMVDYHGVQRKVYNPLIVASGALDYYRDYLKEKDKEQSLNKFIVSADWLVNNAKDKGVYSLWEYEYPWMFYGWVSPPYSSALAQALGLEVLTLAHELTGDEKYLDIAKKTIRSFLVDYEEGGFVSHENLENTSLFLHILAKPGFQKTYVLNGHTNSLLSLWSYYEKTKDPIAKIIFDKGIKYLKENLVKYDTGDWSYYDLMEYLAMTDYHKGHIQQLEMLYEITREPILKDYADRFEKYLKYTPLEE
jgi:heparosan-N-sulfate-glucuronate 5-epimerase